MGWDEERITRELKRKTKVVRRVTVVDRELYGIPAKARWRAAELGLSLRELGKRMGGLSPSRTVEIIDGQTMEPGTLERLSEALEVPLEWWEQSLNWRPKQDPQVGIRKKTRELGKKLGIPGLEW